MNKKLILFVAIISALFSCTALSKQDHKQSLDERKVSRTDTLNQYLILSVDTLTNVLVFKAKKQESIYKIVFLRKSTRKCIPYLRIGKFYNLNLKSVFPENFSLRYGESFVRYGTDMVSLERGNGIIHDLFSIQNAEELCLL